MYDIKGGAIAAFAGVRGGVYAAAASNGDEEDEEEDEEANGDDEDDNENETGDGYVNGGPAASTDITEMEVSAKRPRIPEVVPAVAHAKNAKAHSPILGKKSNVTIHLNNCTS